MVVIGAGERDGPLGVLDRARAALAELAAVPVSCLGGDDLLAWHEGMQQIRSMADAVACASLANGDPQVACTMIAASTRVSARTVRGEQKVGRWLLDYPVFAEALAAGEVSLAHVRAFRRAENPRTAPYLAEAQEYLCEAGRSLPWKPFLDVLRYWELGADPDGEEPREQLAARSCSWRTNPDGTVSGRFHLDPLAGAAFTTAMERIVQRLWRHDQESGSTRTAGQRRADAFLELITEGSGEPLVHVVLSEQVAEDVMARSQGDGGDDAGERWPTDPHDVDGRCELLDGTPIHPHWAAAVLAIARFRRLVFGPSGEILDHGRKTRTFPHQLKQALLVRARGRCQEPGCDAPIAWLEADHLIPWSRAGPTDAANGQILCSRHNKLKRDNPPQAA